MDAVLCFDSPLFVCLIAICLRLIEFAYIHIFVGLSCFWVFFIIPWAWDSLVLGGILIEAFWRRWRSRFILKSEILGIECAMNDFFDLRLYSVDKETLPCSDLWSLMFITFRCSFASSWPCHESGPVGGLGTGPGEGNHLRHHHTGPERPPLGHHLCR